MISTAQHQPNMNLFVAYISFVLSSLLLFFINIKSKDKESAHGKSKGSSLAAGDAAVVLRRLGLWRSDGVTATIHEFCGDEAHSLLEKKEASLEELEEAFGVFDEDGDGAISARELRNVMKRLGFEEGMRLGDCRRMIRTYDADRDGRIGFQEFKTILELAI